MATFMFGARKLRVERSLYDLTLIEWSLDDHAHNAAVDSEASDEKLMDTLAPVPRSRRPSSSCFRVVPDTSGHLANGA